MTTSPPASPAVKGSVAEVFVTFLKLGVTSFGGPIAHLGYFRRELVERRGWVADNQYAQLLALCQFLPGPASSQLGFSLGLLRAGWGGALAAFLAFTLPSALLLFVFAGLLPHLSGPAGSAVIHGLKLVALAVVAHGVLGMTRTLCPDPSRRTIASIAAGLALLIGQAWGQLLIVALGAMAGLRFCRDVPHLTGQDLPLPHGRTSGGWLLGLCALLLIGLPLAAGSGDGLIAVAAAFYRAGALVFGGGHVVLPLLEELVVRPGGLTADAFLAGYGAAQAVPGPMFSLAAYLGGLFPGAAGGLPGAATALGAIFLPGFLLVAGILPFWRTLALHPQAASAVAGVSAAVVGLLGAALYDPVWTGAVGSPVDLAIALVGFSLLAVWRMPSLMVVGWCVVASLGRWLLS
jgi:chromate transporter